MSSKFAAAKAILQTRGWCQKQPEDEKGRCCLHQALLLAAGPGVSVESEMRVVIQHVVMSPIKWNDSPGRTLEEVIDLLERLDASPQPVTV